MSKPTAFTERVWRLLPDGNLLAVLAFGGMSLVVQPFAAKADSLTEFTVPGAAASIRAIARGPDGAIWYAAETTNKIGRMTTSGTVTEFDVTTAASAPYGIALGPDGNLWFTESAGNKIGKITPTGTITEFPVPTAAAGVRIITAGPDNRLWFVEQNANKIGAIATNGTITEYNVPTAAASVYAIAPGPDGNLWFGEQAGAANKVGRITPAGVITEFPVVTAGAGPVFTAAGVDGNIWVTEYLANKVARVTPAGTVTEFTVPTAASSPYQILSGPDGALWFAEFNTNKIARMTTSGSVTGELISPSSGNPFTMTIGPDLNPWYSKLTANIIGRVNVTPPTAASPLLASILPTSRSVQVGNFATVFATIANNSLTPQTQCRVATDTYVPGFFSYQTTNPATNALSGTPNTSAPISANGLQTYVLAFRAGAPLPPTDVKFVYICDGVQGATPITGVNTLQLVFDAGPVADMIAVGVTPSNDGYSHTGGNSGTGVFAVATTNIGPATVLTAKPRLSDPSLPLTVTICETNASAACLAPPAAQVSRSFGNNEASSFGVFIKANGAVPPDPAARRVFLEFLDGGSIVRGSTSTAVTTQ